MKDFPRGSHIFFCRFGRLAVPFGRNCREFYVNPRLSTEPEMAIEFGKIWKIWWVGGPTNKMAATPMLSSSARR